MISEIFTKSFSFILFWILGIKLTGIELNEFLLEMPFIFIFSTVLSFGVSTYFLDQKKNNEILREKLIFSLSLVFSLNILIIILLFICFFVNILSLNSLLLTGVAVTLNLNQVLGEFFFVKKNYLRMAFTCIVPKILFFIVLLFLNEHYSLKKDVVYSLIILAHTLTSFQILTNLKFKFSINDIISYFKFTWIITLQPLLIYFAYVSYRYFLNTSNDSIYLIEFSVLQTFMGFYAFLISVANRFLIHEIYESLIEGIVLNVLPKKFLLFQKVFFLVSFIFLNTVIFYIDYKLNLEITIELFIGIYVISIASLLNYISQFYKSMIVFNKDFYFLLGVNVLTTIITLFLTYLCSLFEIDIFYPLSLVVVNISVFALYQSKVDISFFNELIPKSELYKGALILFFLTLFEYVNFTNYKLYIISNVVIFLILITDTTIYMFKNRILHLNS